MFEKILTIGIVKKIQGIKKLLKIDN